MSAPTPGPGSQRAAGDSNMSRTYASVALVWLVVLAALFAFQQYFTH